MPLEGFRAACEEIRSGANVLAGDSAAYDSESDANALRCAFALYMQMQQQVRMKELCAASPSGSAVVFGPGFCQ